MADLGPDAIVDGDEALIGFEIAVGRIPQRPIMIDRGLLGRNQS